MAAPIRSGAVLTVLLASTGLLACAASDDAGADKIPITTVSDEARNLYVQARDLQDNINFTDAHALFERAVAADPGFAMGYVGLANTAPSNAAFIDAVQSAVGLADEVSEGERLIILSLQAGLRSDPEGQMGHLTALTQQYPNDERAHALLGNLFFNRQDYANALKQYGHAIAINPNFATVYNQMGYAQRFQGDLEAAEASFQKYIELIPDDPNPRDSYAELLMKMGRFDASIAQYEQAIAMDANWVNGFVGIGNDQMFQGHFDEARATFAKELDVARNTGERRQAKFWIAASYVHQGQTARAIAAVEEGRAMAEADGDMSTVAGDWVLIGNIQREAGQYDQALASLARALETMRAAEGVPEAFKTNAARNALFQQGLVAVARGDLETARARLDAYAQQVAMANLPAQVRQQHELAGRIALADKDYATALSELAMANQQDPVVLYLTALAHQGAGDTTRAREFAVKVADFNELNFNLAFVRAKARQMAGQ